MGHQEDIVKTESKIIVIRDTQVILDRDVAELYGVETREINQALRNNPKKFPPGYVIELNNNEKEELIKNFDRFKKLKHSTVAPHAFTEQGLYMLATILKGDLAISTTIAIIDTFTQLRKLARSIDKVNEDAKEHGILPDKATILNEAQLELLDLVSVMDSKEEIEGLRKVITDYLGAQLKEELDRLWADGTLNEEKVEVSAHYMKELLIIRQKHHAKRENCTRHKLSCHVTICT